MEPTGDSAAAFGSQLACMVDDPRYADVQLLVGEEATPVYASKVILIARSPVFKASLSGNFREGQPPPSASSSTSSPSSSSSSSSSMSTSSETSWSSSLPPVFWHRAEVPDVERATMRHLLHCLYTDQLHPDLVTSSSEAASVCAPTNYYNEDSEDATMTQQEQDLVALYAAADRYLVDMAKSLARAELVRHFDRGDRDTSHVLAAFDLALAVAPELAESVFQPLIEDGASLFLDMGIKSTEAQWLGLSDDAAARIVGTRLRYIDEIQVFDAIQRRYRHHLAQAKEPGDDAAEWAKEEDDNGGGEMDERSEEMRRRKRKAREEAKKKVAGLLSGIITSLLSVHELCKFVKPSGLFTDAQLLAADEHSRSSQRYFMEDLASSAVRDFGDVHVHDLIRWSLAVQRTNAAKDGYEVHLRIEPRVEGACLPSLSAEGVTIDVYCDRRHDLSFCADATTLVAVPGVLRVPFNAPPEGRVAIVIRVPPTAFTRL